MTTSITHDLPPVGRGVDRAGYRTGTSAGATAAGSSGRACCGATATSARRGRGVGPARTARGTAGSAGQEVGQQRGLRRPRTRSGVGVVQAEHVLVSVAAAGWPAGTGRPRIGQVGVHVPDRRRARPARSGTRSTAAATTGSEMSSGCRNWCAAVALDVFGEAAVRSRRARCGAGRVRGVLASCWVSTRPNASWIEPPVVLAGRVTGGSSGAARRRVDRRDGREEPGQPAGGEEHRPASSAGPRNTSSLR